MSRPVVKRLHLTYNSRGLIKKFTRTYILRHQKLLIGKGTTAKDTRITSNHTVSILSTPNDIKYASNTEHQLFSNLAM